MQEKFQLKIWKYLKGNVEHKGINITQSLFIVNIYLLYQYKDRILKKENKKRGEGRFLC